MGKGGGGLQDWLMRRGYEEGCVEELGVREVWSMGF